jgi:ABC-type multidrug transport system permease subunit
MHAPIRFLPLAALNDALRAIYNEGAGFLDVWSQVLILATWGGLGFIVAVRSFRWQ